MIETNEANAKEAAQILKAFLEPFPAEEIKIRPQGKPQGNRCLALSYIDARCVMDRLDDVVGVNGWKDAYVVLPTEEVECQLSVRIAGEWITKADVGGQSEQPDEGDRMKAAYSDSLKRAAVKFGIGRFLYRLKAQWMDYDPQKRQIVRPEARKAPAKTAAPAAPKAPERPDDREYAGSDPVDADMVDYLDWLCGSRKKNPQALAGRFKRKALADLTVAEYRAAVEGLSKLAIAQAPQAAGATA